MLVQIVENVFLCGMVRPPFYPSHRPSPAAKTVDHTQARNGKNSADHFEVTLKPLVMEDYRFDIVLVAVILMLLR